MSDSTVSASGFPELDEDATPLDRVLDHRPDYAAAMRDIEAAIWAQDAVSPQILELCRLRIAQLLAADDDLAHRTPIDPPLDEDLIASLRYWPTDPRFTEEQKVALGYAEQLLVDAQGVTDDDAAHVIATLGEGAYLVLAYGCGFFETTQRARILLATRRHP